MEKKPTQHEHDRDRRHEPARGGDAGEAALANRETWVRARERAADARESAVGSREMQLVRREELARLREEALRARAEADEVRADRERLLIQARDANEKLVIATIRADELAESASAARDTLAGTVAALRESVARYRTLFESIDEGFCVIEVLFDPDGTPADFRYVEANPAFEEQSGLHDVIGKRIRELVPDVEDRWAQIYGNVVATGEPARFVNEAGPLRRWFDVYAFRIGEARDRRVACLFTDVTDRKRTEALLQAASRAKDEFLAMLGHELRNPLAPILTALDLMAMRDPGASERERKIIHRQVSHLVHLVDDLLDVSRITSGKIDLHREPTELADVVARAVEMASPLLEKKAHDLVVDVARPGLAVDGDATRLAQVVANLVTNAAKYTPARGRIVVTGRRCEGTVSLRVRDSGIGISRDMLPHVFELFVQERQATDRSMGGLGLGLALVRSLVAMHGGTVSAHSEGPGRGSEFAIELPALATEVEPQPRARGPRATLAPDARPPGVHTILVVDDNRDAAEVLANALSAAGYEVQVAFDGPSAIEIARAFMPDVALLDLGLPVMDGYELAGRLRALLAHRPTRFIAITGYGQEVDRRRSRDAGFALHLVKPVDTSTILDGLRQVAERLPSSSSSVDPAT